MPLAKPVLELDTLAPERPTVKIKSKIHPRGKIYEIAVIEDIGLRDQAKLGRLGNQVAELGPLAEAFIQGESEDEDALLGFERAVDAFLAIVILELEADVLSALKIADKEALVDAFTNASPTLAKAVRQARKPPRAPRKKAASRKKKASTRAR